MDRTAIAEALQRDHVLAWLDSHQPAATVGTARRADDCPLARYVRAQTGQDVRVSQEAVSEPDEAEAGRVGAVLVELDRWAKWFTRLVDWGFPAKGQVTATEAKAVLERASKRTSDPVPCETEGCPSAYALLAGFCL